MSDTQAKATPSKAARELAEALYKAGWLDNVSFTPEMAKTGAAQVINAELHDLLEKAEKVLLLTHEHISPTLAKDLRLELHRWQPK